eukprot:UN14696
MIDHLLTATIIHSLHPLYVELGIITLQG